MMDSNVKSREANAKGSLFLQLKTNIYDMTNLVEVNLIKGRFALTNVSKISIKKHYKMMRELA